MKNLVKRGLSLLLVLVMCLSLLPAIQTPAQATVQNVTYVTGSTSQYSNYSNIIKNWGTRGTTATFLSQNAAAFYTGDNTYANFSVMDGATSTSDVPSSELYLALKNFMASNHTSITSYDATRDLFAFTDCQNSALTNTKISSFYSGTELGPAWDSGATWNREHTWPDSKGLAGSDENDIMMLRPTASSENSSRGNKAYGVSTGYYHPNSKSDTDGDYSTISTGEYDLRGDVARIALYVYVRWGNTANMWGTSGVIESKDVLLDWMEADPVDTWELGRNDSVQSITGTRNVFVDYPELAFALFEEEVPADYTTPSGIGDGSTGGDYTLTFKQAGATKGTAASSAALPEHFGTVPEGYTFEGWVTAPVSETTEKPAVYKAGTTFTATADTTLHALYSQSTSGGAASYVKVTSAPSDWSGTYLIVYEAGKYAMNGSLSTLEAANNYVSVTISDNAIAATALLDASSFTIALSGSSYTIKSASGYYIGNTGTSNKLMTSTSTQYTNTITMNGTTPVIKGSGGNALQFNKASNQLRFRYFGSTQQAIALYVKQETTLTTYTTASCTHTSTVSKAVVPAKCDQVGYEAGTWCNNCESYVDGGTVIPALGHEYDAVVTPPTTTSDGYTTYTCANGCGDSYVADYVDALSYTVSFSVPAGVTKPANVQCNSTAFSLPTPEGTPLGEQEYSFVGWAEAAVDNSTEIPELITGKYSASESVTLYAIYSYTVGSSGSGFVLVTDASQLTIGASVIIAAKDYNFALSTTQNTNNRGQAAVTKDTTNKTLEPSTSVAILTLEEGTTSGTYAFNTGSGYLYAASSKSNHLKTQTSLNANGSWQISVDAEGIATVKAQGTNSRNWMRYNSSNNPPLFACYSSGQKDISLYIRTGEAGTTYYTSDIDLGATEDGTLAFKGVNLTLKDSQYLNFNALQSVVDQYENVYAVLEADGKQTAVVTDPFTHTDLSGNIRYNYSFRDLTVLDFGLEVKATLYGTKDGKLYCSPTVSYSLLQYCTTAIADEDNKDAVPCAYLLKYVQAAEEYKSVAAENRIEVPSNLDSLLDTGIEATVPAQTVTVANGTQVTFKGQHLQMEAKLNLEVKVLLKDTAVDTSKVTLTVAYKDVYGSDVSKEYDFADLVAGAEENVYLLAIKDLYASQMGETVTVTIAINGVVESTLQTSIESYCTAIISDNNYSANMQALAKRIFLYGEAVEATYAS